MGVLFWSCFAALAFAYLGYPIVLVLGSFFGARRSGFGEAANVSWPDISVILTVFNGEKLICQKIRNCLAQAYPGSIELVVISDGSNDDTVPLIKRLEDRRVRLIEHRERRGKDARLAEAVAQASGEILVFTDAGAFFGEKALEKLVRPFSDPRVGLVTGVARYTGAQSVGLYRRYEDWLKSLEADLGALSGALGPMYAMRRSVWRPKQLPLFNDFADPILVAMDGKIATIATSAVCYQDRSADEHWARQVRNVACASAVLFHHLPGLIAARRWKLIFVLISHKLVRWLTVPLMALLMVAAWIERASGGVYRATLLVGAAYLSAAALGFFVKKLRVAPPLHIAYDFLAMNCAAVVGLMRFARGQVPTVWQPRGL